MAYQSLEYKALDVVFRPGDIGGDLYIVEQGEFERLREIGGETASIDLLRRGDLFGEPSIFADERRVDSVRALTDGRLVKVEAGRFQHLLDRRPDLSIRLIRQLSHRVSDAEVRLSRLRAEAPGDGDETLVAPASQAARRTALAKELIQAMVADMPPIDAVGVIDLGTESVLAARDQPMRPEGAIELLQPAICGLFERGRVLGIEHLVGDALDAPHDATSLRESLVFTTDLWFYVGRIARVPRCVLVLAARHRVNVGLCLLRARAVCGWRASSPA
ncbi:MAG: cyclic nucleotide-binding domain-containing protein [Acidobacteriota bacterium]